MYKRQVGFQSADGWGDGLTLGADADLVGDSWPELLVGVSSQGGRLEPAAAGGAPVEVAAGAVYMVDLTLPAGFELTGALDAPIQYRLLDGDALVKFVGARGGDGAGWSMAAVGDLDADGRDEVLIGAPGAGLHADSAGAVYVVRGGAEMATGCSHAQRREPVSSPLVGLLLLLIFRRRRPST